MTALNLNKGGTAYTAPITLPPGTAGNPPLQWTDGGLGIWQSGTATLSLVVAGSSVMAWSASGVAITGTISASGGVAFDTITANAIVGGDSSLGITGQDSAVATAGAVVIAGGAHTAVATGDGGAVSLTGGAITAALAGGDGGSVTLTGGAARSGAGGSVNLVGGASASGTAGTVQINSDPNIAFATYMFTGTPAATDQAFFISPRAMLVKSVVQVHSVAAGGVSTLTVTKDTGTAAPGAGTTIQQGSFNLNATANTVQTGTLAASAATLTLAAGDRLAVKFANSIQSSAGIVVTVGMMPA